MKFLYPLGLLGLICIPVLILIYILKNKYIEKIISSTYIWRLSEKFLKKKKPLKKITDLVSLIVQIITVFILSISIAHPVFVVPNSAENICFVLDVSGSMNIKNGSSTRFELGKQRIIDLINDSNNGSTYTLITASNETKVLLEQEENKEKVLNKLDEIKVDYTSSSLEDALMTIQNFYNEQKVGHVYLVTDKTYDKVSNIDLINVSSQEENFSIYDSKYQIKNKKINISGNVMSYESDQTLSLVLYLDDQIVESQEIEVNKMVEKSYSFTIDEKEFSSLKIEIANEDALLMDNSNILYSIGNKNVCSTLIVSGTSTFYVSSILKAIGNVNIKEVSPANYRNESGYDLYIFDSYSPSVLPNDGAVWLINTSKNIANSGFVVQDSISLENGGIISYDNGKSSLYNEITKNTKNNSISINKYNKYGLYRDFTTILSIDKIPLLFVGSNDYGNREIVFSFDFQNTDFPLLYDYVVLMRNFINYSNPSPLENRFYKVGDEISVNIVNDCKSVKVVSPNNTISYLDTSFNQASFSLEEVGTYQFDFLINDEIKTYKIFVEFDSEESKVVDNEISIDLINTSNNLKFDGTLDNLFIVIILACVLFLFDWMWYSYEQH